MADGRIVILVDVDGNEVTDLNNNLDQLEGKSQKAGTSISSMVKALGLVKIASAAFNVLKSSLDSAISRFDTMQKFPKVMSALGFSAEESQKSIDKLGDGIDGLPTKLDDVVASTQQMTAITGDLDRSTDTVLGLNNAFLASGASSDGAARGMQQYNKIISTGKVELDSWQTLQETMPLALQKTAEAMGFAGKSAQNDLYAALQSGEVTIDQFTDKIIELGTGTGMLAQLAKENSLGIATSFGNLRNAVAKNIANMITKVDEITQKLSGKTIAQHIDSLKVLINSAGASIVKAMDGIIPLIQKATSFVKEHASAFKILAAVIVSVVSGFIAFQSTIGIINSVFNAIKGVKTALGLMKAAIIANPFALLIAGIAALAAGLVYFYKTSDSFRSKVDGLVNTLKSFMAPIGDVINGIKLLAQAFKAIVFNDFSVSVADLHTQFVKLFPESLWNGMTSFAQSVKAVVQGINILAQAFKAIALNDFSVSVSDLKADFLELFPESLWNGMTRIAQSVKNLIGGFKDSQKSIDPLGIALKVLKTVLLGLLGPVGLVIKAFELIAKSLGGGDISKGIDSVLSGFDSLASGLKSNGPKIGQSTGKALEGVLAAIAGALPGIIAGGLKIVAAIVSGIAKGIPSLTLAASQLIMAFTAAMLVLVPQIALSATAIIVALLGALTAGLPQIILAGGSLIIALLEGISEQLPALIESAATLIVTWLTSLTEHIPAIIIAGMSLLIAFIDGIAQKLPDLVIAVGELIVTFIAALSGQLPAIIRSGADLMISFLNGLASKMPDIVSAALNLIVQFLNGLASKAGDVITAGVNLIVSILNGIANSIDCIVAAGMKIVDAAVEGVIKAQDRLFKAAVRLVNGMADNIRNNRGELTSAGRNLLDAIIEGIPGNGLVSAGYDLIMGLAQGIGNAASAAVTAAQNVASSILSKVTGFFDINSPSRVMRDKVGKYLPQGIAVGIEADAGTAIRAMNNLSADLLNTITPESALGVANIGTTSSVNQIVNNSYSNGNSNRGMIDAIVKLANRPAIFKQEVDKREFSRIFAEPITEQQVTRQSIIKSVRGEV